MSEDRLERALQAMREETVDAGTLQAARTRVWDRVANTADVCAEFRQDFRAYLGHELRPGRRILVDDHLSRCPGCRTHLAGMTGGRPAVAMPPRSSSRWLQRGALAAAAALVVAGVYLGLDTIDGLMAPAGPRATVVSVDGGLYRVAVGPLPPGAMLGDRDAVRTGPGAHAVLQLADGSMVDVNERTELFVTAAWSGQTIHLQRGDIIVKAAPQPQGRLRVLTRDSVASVKGTVFAVSAGMGGSVVSVLEGSVAVTQPGRDVVLSPGQQAASIPALTSTVAQAVSWSPDAEAYLQLLGSFAVIERELANFPPGLRTTPTLLSYLPAAAVVYAALPNPGLTVGRAVSLADWQSTRNPTFAAWWNSDTGRHLREMADRLQTVSPLLGDEIVFSASVPGQNEAIPVVLARVQPGGRTQLETALQGLLTDAGEFHAAYAVSDDLMVVSDSPAHLAWAFAHLGQGARSLFATAIEERYQRGVGWLMAMDAAPLVTMGAADDAPPLEFAGMIGMQYLFLEQRAPAGVEENEVTITFGGARTGMGAWLADGGSGGAAEYLPSDALVAGYISTREPSYLFDELTAQIRRVEPDFDVGLAAMDETLGTGFVQNLTAALGTEAALAMTGLSAAGPTWVMAMLTHDPVVVDDSLRRVVEAFNAALGTDEQGRRIVLEQEHAGGRAWTTMKPGGVPLRITWTYDRGYLVAGSDRAVAERALATRNGGFPLVWSPSFLAQLPSSAGLHPSAFAWINTQGALGFLSSLAPNAALGELMGGRAPVLVLFDGTAEQIRAASRTRLTGLILDVMLLESLSRVPGGG